MESLQRHSVFCVQGGGLYIFDGTVILVKCNVHSNTATKVCEPASFPVAIVCILPTLHQMRIRNPLPLIPTWQLGPNIYIKDDSTYSYEGNVLGSGGSHAPRLCTFGTTLEGVHGTVDNDCAAPPPSPPALGPAEASMGNDPRAVSADGDAFHFRGAAHTKRPGKKHALAKKVKN